MFERLDLRAFGRFLATSVKLGPATVALGGNESGKTTLLDAVTAALAPQANTEDRVERYGEEAEATLVGDGTTTDAGAVWPVHAIREGVVRFGSDDEAWRARIVEQLERREIPAHAIRDALAAHAQGSATESAVAAHTQRIDELQQQRRGLEQARERLRDLLLQRRRTLAERREVDDRRDGLREELACETARQANRAERRSRSERLEIVQEQIEEVSALAPLHDVEPALMAELEALDAAVTAERSKRDGIGKRRTSGSARLQSTVDAITRARDEEPLRKRAAARAAVLHARLQAQRPEPIERRTWRAGRLTVAVMLVLLGLASPAALAGVVPWVGTALPFWLLPILPYVGMAVCLALGSVVWAGARELAHEPDVTAEAFLLREVLDEWHTDPDLPRLEAETIADALLTFERHVRAYDDLSSSLRQRMGYTCRAEEELAVILDTHHGMLEQTLSNRVAERDAWLQEHGIDDRDAFVAAIECKLRLQHRIGERSAAFELSSDAEALHRLAAQLREELEALPETSDTGTDAVALERQIAAADSEHWALAQQLQSLEAESVEIATAAGGPDVAARLHAVDQQLLDAQKEIAELEAESEAQQIAHSLACELADQGGGHWRALSESATRYLQLAEGTDATLTINGLTERDVLLESDGADGKPIARLSSGLRDVTRMAARLALAERLADDLPPLMALEEPTLRLDEQRAAAVVDMLAAFQRRTGWQVLLITRDARLRDRALDAFPEIDLVELESLQTEARAA